MNWVKGGVALLAFGLQGATLYLVAQGYRSANQAQVKIDQIATKMDELSQNVKALAGLAKPSDKPNESPGQNTGPTIQGIE